MKTSAPSVVTLIELQRAFADWLVDWIQDSLHERNIRAKGPPNPNAPTSRLDKLDGAPGYLWKLLRQALEEGQSWVVITLVGMSYFSEVADS